MENYILFFFIYGVLGWMLEVSFQALKTGSFINRGFLNGPICPIYGLGACTVIFFLSGIADQNKLFLFAGSIFISSVIELVTGILLDKIFHKHWWDYSDRRMNLGGYICLEFSIAWGFLCLFLYDIIHPIVEKFADIIPVKLKIYMLAFCMLIIIIDLISTINTLIGLNKRFRLIDKVNRELRNVSNDIGEKIYHGTIKLEDIQDEIKISKYQERRILKAFPNLYKEIKRIEDMHINKKD